MQLPVTTVKLSFEEKCLSCLAHLLIRLVLLQLVCGMMLAVLCLTVEQWSTHLPQSL